jgi:adenylosuccinate synthase
MPLDILVGAQWGDEGKGRMVDLMAVEADYVARYSGGDNAGHTVHVGDNVYKLHLIPSGLVRPHTIGLLGNGLVVNPSTMLDEILQLQQAGVEVGPERLKVSHAAHMVTPAHVALDKAQEQSRGAELIGTTLRGIGPAYVDKIARHGLRFGQMLDEENFADLVFKHTEAANQQLTQIYNAEPLDAQVVAAEYLDYARNLQPYIADVSAIVSEALSDGKTVLAEGAQGTLLDLDHGSYPYVTSSNPTAAGALIGLGVGFRDVHRVVGVAKSFQTRVGEGPFPTELEGEIASRLRGTGEAHWDEYGTTTGRPRRVGWLDLVLLRYAVRVNGLSVLALTKLDILTGLDPLKLCVGYQKDGQIYKDLPMGPADLSGFEPIYEELRGWNVDISGARTWEDLPSAATAYIQRVESLAGVPVHWVSVGAERDQMVVIG